MKLHLKKLAVLRQINHLLQMNIIAENGILHHKDLLSNGRQMNYKSKTISHSSSCFNNLRPGDKNIIFNNTISALKLMKDLK